MIFAENIKKLIMLIYKGITVVKLPIAMIASMASNHGKHTRSHHDQLMIKGIFGLCQNYWPKRKYQLITMITSKLKISKINLVIDLFWAPGKHFTTPMHVIMYIKRGSDEYSSRIRLTRVLYVKDVSTQTGEITHIIIYLPDKEEKQIF